ncbi:hypothetical protein VT84_33685 [Gemmata sp. SH-PL17]|uniref:sigma-70 family RNA polymerase sigma factor n=1 Tax=Gemmata sp. SH-PL17 TaxID=1630693 RepID=UPI00078B7928|nr:sigma-70 family RNA polymerase sigma factor [Gemmata sp. SH-PL17]AMV29395.1 hypothetical protein VT84_33685 [Gemmata sp. SH-PL17]
MSLHSTVSEQEFTRTVDQIARLLFKKFGTLHGGRDDFRQQVALWALEALPRYDPGRPLDGFLMRHVRNRALNWSRDHYFRPEPACVQCHSGSPCGPDGTLCQKHVLWLKRNEAKANLARPVGLERVGERTGPSTAEEHATENELTERLDAQLPIELRSYYLRMLAGDPVDTTHRQKVQRAVAEILGLDLPAQPASVRPSRQEHELTADDVLEPDGVGHIVEERSEPRKLLTVRTESGCADRGALGCNR